MERPHGEQTISDETLETFAVKQTFSRTPNLKKGLKFRKLHFDSEMNFRLKFSLIEFFMLAC